MTRHSKAREEPQHSLTYCPFVCFLLLRNTCGNMSGDLPDIGEITSTTSYLVNYTRLQMLLKPHFQCSDHVLSLRVVRIAFISAAVFSFSLRARQRLNLYWRNNDAFSLFFFLNDCSFNIDCSFDFLLPVDCSFNNAFLF